MRREFLKTSAVKLISEILNQRKIQRHFQENGKGSPNLSKPPKTNMLNLLLNAEFLNSVSK